MKKICLIAALLSISLMNMKCVTRPYIGTGPIQTVSVKQVKKQQKRFIKWNNSLLYGLGGVQVILYMLFLVLLNYQPKQKAFDKFYEALEERLNKVGPITLQGAWSITGGNYNTFIKEFRKIMETMIELGKAEKMGKGEYRIIKPNNPLK
jgi:hypothetical protein